MEGFRAKILVIDDEESNLLAMDKILSAEAYSVVCAKQAAIAISLVRKQHFDLVLTDLRMPGVGGMEFLRSLRKTHPQLPVVMLTAYGTVSDAVEAMKLGALDFVSKPIRRETLLKCVQDCLQKSVTGSDIHYNQLIGTSPAIAEIRRTIRMLARTNATVLIEGESGTGKEVVAKAVHSESARTGAMVSLNCGAIPESLLESELFGYHKGAFTGAEKNKMGLFQAAHMGTLFLDEIGEMAPSLQVKLLRVLQDSTFLPLGSREPVRVDVRIVAATNADLKKKILEGKFREDLYYRLNVVSLVLPKLRDRREDIPALAEHFLDFAMKLYKRSGVRFAEDAIPALQEFSWPGNVRELRNLIERTLVMLEGSEITAGDLGLKSSARMEKAPALDFQMSFPVGTSLKEMELEAIRRTLEFTGGDKAKAAEILGINQRTIYRKLPELSES